MKILNEIAEKYESQKGLISNESATIDNLIKPLFEQLGWNFSNIEEVRAQYGAAIGKKGEKVDYAFVQNDLPCLLVECKHHTEPLKRHVNQLYQYFGASKAPLAVLTNGVEYWFFTDTVETNKMDAEPFFVFNILSYTDRDIEVLNLYGKDAFDEERIKTEARRLKYQFAVKAFLNAQYQDPNEDFIRFVIRNAPLQAKAPTMTAKNISSMRPIVKAAIRDFITDNVSINYPQSPVATEHVPVPELTQGNGSDDAVCIVKRIVAQILPPETVTVKQNSTYIGILVNGKPTKWICRLYLGPGQMYVGIPDEKCLPNKNRKIKIQSIDDIWGKAQEIISSASRFSK